MLVWNGVSCSKPKKCHQRLRYCSASPWPHAVKAALEAPPVCSLHPESGSRAWRVWGPGLPALWGALRGGCPSLRRVGSLWEAGSWPLGPGEVDGHCMVSAGQHGVRLSALQFSEKYLIEWRSGETNDKNAIPNKIWGRGGLNPDCCRQLVSSHQNVTLLFRHRSETTATV